MIGTHSDDRLNDFYHEVGFRRVFSSSVGSKLFIGFTGLLLFAYLILHLVGNLMVFGGQELFNHYAHMLVSNPLVIPAEIALLLFFALHIYKTVTMYVGNQRARPQGYEKKTWAGHRSRKSLASTTMIWTGLLILIFVIVHLAQMKFGALYQIGDPPIRDLYRTEVEVFSSPFWVGAYVACMRAGEECLPRCEDREGAARSARPHPHLEPARAAGKRARAEIQRDGEHAGRDRRRGGGDDAAHLRAARHRIEQREAQVITAAGRCAAVAQASLVADGISQRHLSVRTRGQQHESRDDGEHESHTPHRVLAQEHFHVASSVVGNFASGD